MFYSYPVAQIFIETLFPPNVISEWNKLKSSIWNSESFNIFRNKLLKLIRPTPKSIFNIRNSTAFKSIHVFETWFNHNFENTVNPLCPCSLEAESVEHFFLHCHNFTTLR